MHSLSILFLLGFVALLLASPVITETEETRPLYNRNIQVEPEYPELHRVKRYGGYGYGGYPRFGPYGFGYPAWGGSFGRSWGLSSSISLNGYNNGYYSGFGK
uniref:Neuropeptide-like protein 31 n=1 Tax=Heterorhabditis bacteriophora TaxID=37862 RepID=A0A1I7XI50_HETBA